MNSFLNFGRPNTNATDNVREGEIVERLAALEARLSMLSAEISDLAKFVKAAVDKPRGVELLKKLGVTPARFLERYFESLPEVEFYEALHGGSQSLRRRPSELGLSSSLCRQIHFATDEFRYWMSAMARPPRMHRKEWEWFYIAQALFERGMLQPGKKGLVFAVGQEPLPAVFSTFGCQILATDQAPDKAAESGWAGSGMYSDRVDMLFYERICTREQFDAGVSYANVDMNEIPLDLSSQFDFCWSSCAFEHLGSLEHGMSFVQRSIDTLSPGGRSCPHDRIQSIFK